MDTEQTFTYSVSDRKATNSAISQRISSEVKRMIIEINFKPIERSEVREAIIAAFDLLSEKEKGNIFRDDYGIVCQDNPGQVILEVSDEEDSDTKCLVWQDDRWHEVLI
jgi:hypothetical protein